MIYKELQNLCLYQNPDLCVDLKDWSWTPPSSNNYTAVKIIFSQELVIFERAKTHLKIFDLWLCNYKAHVANPAVPCNITSSELKTWF